METEDDLKKNLCAALLNKDPGLTEKEIEKEYDEFEGPGQLRLRLQQFNVTLRQLLTSDKEKFKDLGGGRWTGLPYIENLVAIKATLDNKKPEVRYAEERERARRERMAYYNGSQPGPSEGSRNERGPPIREMYHSMNDTFDAEDPRQRHAEEENRKESGRCFDIGVWTGPSKEPGNGREEPKRVMMRHSLQNTLDAETPPNRYGRYGEGRGCTKRGSWNFNNESSAGPSEVSRSERERSGRDMVHQSMSNVPYPVKPQQNYGKKDGMWKTGWNGGRVGTIEESRNERHQPQREMMHHRTLYAEQPQKRYEDENGLWKIGHWNDENGDQTGMIEESKNGRQQPERETMNNSPSDKKPEKRDGEEHEFFEIGNWVDENEARAGAVEESRNESHQPREETMHHVDNAAHAVRPSERYYEEKGRTKRVRWIFEKENRAGSSEQSKSESAQPKRGEMTYDQVAPKDPRYYEHDYRKSSAEERRFSFRTENHSEVVVTRTPVPMEKSQNFTASWSHIIYSKPSTDLFSFEVVQFSGLGDFTVRVTDYGSSIETITKELKHHASSPETSLIHDSWKVGDGCMVTILQEEEEMLYRGVLMKSTSENTFSVYLIDIGISVDRKIPQLKTLPPDHLAIYPLAIRCTLDADQEKLLAKAAELEVDFHTILEMESTLMRRNKPSYSCDEELTHLRYHNFDQNVIPICKVHIWMKLGKFYYDFNGLLQ
ncbi:hypothetical protein CAEBREN_08197 [Caenorhabditis brenneri]|uniref:Tudor domain-containing protein n=1 Tax=Caenorhabditis brenneri TaxID=135651 RepID=G0PB78_CAEBE|nr:hypothetical protein CAEBREN_08197 [Caenorhabditis brenneri]